MPQLVYEKMGITADHSLLIVDGPDDAIAEIRLPTLYAKSATAGVLYDHIVLFIKDQKDMVSQFPKYRSIMKTDGRLWIVWPKGGQLGTDLNIKVVIRIGYDHGLVESTNLRIDNTWTALKFTHPKPGKIYNNSYGNLKN